MHFRLCAAGSCRLRFGIGFALIFLAAHFSFPESNSRGVKIGNFGQINANYYRGGQPKESDCLDLKKLGIATVIDLRKDKKPAAASWVQGAGMRYVNIPLSSSRPATAEQTSYFLELVNDPKNWPVYVHCAAGKHRTGEMTAIYRIANDGWTADQAFAEMQRYGFYSFPNHGSLKKYVYQFFQSFRKQ